MRMILLLSLFSAANWLKPPKSFQKRVLSSYVPHWLSWRYLRNNLRSVIYLLLFIAVNIGLFLVGSIYYREKGVPVAIARGCGQCLNFNPVLVIILMMRRGLTWLRSTRIANLLPLDQHIELHKLAGYTIMFFALVHTAAHLVNLCELHHHAHRTPCKGNELPTCTVYLYCLPVLPTCTVYLYCPPVLSTCTAYLYCLHVLPTCTAYLYCLHVLPTCTAYLYCLPVYLYCLPVLSTCTAYLYCLPVLPTCTAYLYCLPVLSTCTAYMYCLPVLPTCTVYLYCLPVLSTCTVYLYCLPILTIPTIVDVCLCV